MTVLLFIKIKRYFDGKFSNLAEPRHSPLSVHFNLLICFFYFSEINVTVGYQYSSDNG